MLPLFCLRLALGLAAALLVVSPAQVNPRFYRVQFHTVLALALGAGLFLRHVTCLGMWLALGGGALAAVLGSLSYALEGAPAGRSLTVLTTGLLTAALGFAGVAVTPEAPATQVLTNELTSAALLGAATSAMLMGHSYLIAPTMSITPLLRLLAALFVATTVRLVVAGVGLWSWTAEHSLGTLTDVTIWLPVRWLLGFGGPLGLGWMAWQTAKIRSTQSATGILYVVVILGFLGELTSQLLVGTTGYLL
jgi:hypothetical protein